MPLIRISMRRGRPASEPAAIIDGVYKALRETFEVPEKDLFAVVHQHDLPARRQAGQLGAQQRQQLLQVARLVVAGHDAGERCQFTRRLHGRAWRVHGALRRSRAAAPEKA